MRGFLASAVLGLGVFLIALIALNAVLPVPEMRNEALSQKVATAFAPSSDYNLFLIGSSKIHRHFDPEVIDSVFTGAGMTSHTFNLGVDGTYPPETYQLLRDLLKSGRLNNKFVLLEVKSVHEIGYRNWHLPRTGYWLDMDGTQELVALSHSSYISLPRRLFAWVSYGINAVDRVARIGYYANQLGFKKSGSVVSNRGFKPYETQLDCSDRELLPRQNEVVRKMIDTTPPTLRSQFHFKQLEELLKLAEFHNCRLLFYAAEAKLAWQLREIIPLFAALPEEHTLAAYDSRTYEFLKDCSLRADPFHFNTAGAQVHSQVIGKAMAEKFKQIK